MTAGFQVDYDENQKVLLRQYGNIRLLGRELIPPKAAGLDLMTLKTSHEWKILSNIARVCQE